MYSMFLYVKKYLPLVALAFFFVVSGVVVSIYETQISEVMAERKLVGAFVYMVVTIIATVCAPLSSVPLIPLASHIWGPFLTGVMSITSWILGAFIIFYICRRYGIDIIVKFIPVSKVQKIERVLPSENAFWSHIILRMFIPVDVLSYALALFTKISFAKYIVTTAIGIIPFAFVFAYAGALPVSIQISGFVVGVVMLMVIYVKRARFK